MIFVPQSKTATYPNSVRVNGIFLWNNLNSALRQINYVKNFKSMLFKLLLDRYSTQLCLLLII